MANYVTTEIVGPASMIDSDPVKADDAQESGLLVQAGDVIAKGSGRNTWVVLIAWTNRSYNPGATDPQKQTPVDAIWLVPPVGYGNHTGSALQSSFLSYQGWLTFSDDHIDQAIAEGDDFAAREGHTWKVNVDGYRHVTHPWWEHFRNQELST